MHNGQAIPRTAWLWQCDFVRHSACTKAASGQAYPGYTYQVPRMQGWDVCRSSLMYSVPFRCWELFAPGLTFPEAGYPGYGSAEYAAYMQSMSAAGDGVWSGIWKSSFFVIDSVPRCPSQMCFFLRSFSMWQFIEVDCKFPRSPLTCVRSCSTNFHQVMPLEAALEHQVKRFTENHVSLHLVRHILFVTAPDAFLQALPRTPCRHTMALRMVQFLGPVSNRHSFLISSTLRYTIKRCLLHGRKYEWLF